jgi:hypothetical protein
VAIQRNSIHAYAGYEREVIKLFVPRGHPHSRTWFPPFRISAQLF